MTDPDGSMDPDQRAVPGDQPLDPVELAFVAKLRARVPVPADFDTRVMDAVRAERVHRSASDSGARFRAAHITMALSGLALAASVAFVISGKLVHRAEPARPTPAVASESSRQPHAVYPRTVRFTLVRTGASRVAVAGSFNGWNASQTPLRQISADTWEAEVPLGAGRYVYQFVVDGTQWVTDPDAPHDASDDFGAINSVVTVASGASS